jgi:hypothetical protein
MFIFFDFEVYPNLTLMVCKANGVYREYIKYNNQWVLGNAKDLNIIRQNYLVGYNSNSYDLQIFKAFMNNESNEKIKKLSDSIIASKTRQFPDKKLFPKSIDLKLVIFNKEETAKSLKLIGCDLKHHKLQELPIEPSKVLDDAEVSIIRDYCKNDVDITEKLFIALKDKIDIRLGLDLDVLSSSDSGISNRLVEKWYSDITGLEVAQFKHLRTTRERLYFRDAILGNQYNYLVRSPIAKWIWALHFIWIENGNYFGIDDAKFQKKFKETWLKWTFHNVTIQLGIGGIHSEDESGLFSSNLTESIIDYDIDGLYPTLNINHQINPAHLDKKLIQKFKEERDERLRLKKLKDDKSQLLQKTKKLVLNSYVGKYMSDFFFLKDDLCNLQVTLNGQLYLLVLLDWFYQHNIEVLSINTDGITCNVANEQKEIYYKIVEEFNNKFNFTGEFNIYKKYIRRDGNNYLAITQDNKIKTKGIFVKQQDTIKGDLAFTKGFSYPIITIALHKYFLNNIKPEDYIPTHKDIYDFCKAQKSGKQFKNELRLLRETYTEIIPLQNTIRFYVSNKPEELVKYKMVNNQKKYTKYNANANTSLFLDYTDLIDINYNWYINETWKIIKTIEK